MVNKKDGVVVRPSNLKIDFENGKMSFSYSTNNGEINQVMSLDRLLGEASFWQEYKDRDVTKENRKEFEEAKTKKYLILKEGLDAKVKPLVAYLMKLLNQTKHFNGFELEE